MNITATEILLFSVILALAGVVCSLFFDLKQEKEIREIYQRNYYALLEEKLENENGRCE